MADLDGHKWCVLRKNPQPTSGHASPEFVSIMPNDRLVVDPSHLLFIPNLLALQVLNRSPRFVGYAVHTSFFCLNQPKKNWTKKSSCNPSPLKLCPKKNGVPPPGGNFAKLMTTRWNFKASWLHLISIHLVPENDEPVDGTRCSLNCRVPNRWWRVAVHGY